MKTIIPVFHMIITICCFGLLPNAPAVVPPPDGGYPGFNTAEGQNALFSLTTGAANTAVGWYSLFSNTDGSFNTALGAGALLFNTPGSADTGEGIPFSSENTAVGAAALLFNTTGAGNTATGTAALLNNITGEANTATGQHALFANETGFGNTAVGQRALELNTEGGANTAVGVAALSENISSDNTAIGGFALADNTEGFDNTAIGRSALSANTLGEANTASGAGALSSNTTGVSNTAVGLDALGNNTSGNNNVALGRNAGINQTNGANNVYIGFGIGGTAGESDACYIRSIFSQTSAGGTQVFINSSNKLGTTTSSKRFKEEIKPMNQTSEALFALKPVTFRYKKEIDPVCTPQFGLVAEDVEKVNPALIVRDKEGRPYSVRYEQVNAMLLNEFLKEHSRVQEQEATIAQLKKTIETVLARLNEQELKIQKVHDQLEISHARRVVLNQ